jgi:phosphoribosylamine--glycine ligase / phosphoribosylformylglycinamidine cyclo-ligase
VGRGDRGIALAFKLSRSPLIERIYVAPGNGGTGEGIEKVSNIDLDENDFAGLIRVASDLNINLAVPGKSL